MTAPDASDGELAARLAAVTGAALTQRRGELFAQGLASWLVMDEGDAVGQHTLATALHQLRPDDAVLSEEGADDPRRFVRDRVWIVDPLDGTREFGEPGRTDWAVHVALWDHGRLVAGAVALPATGMLYATVDPPALPDVRRTRPIFIASRSRPSWATQVAANAIGGTITALGSAGAKAMAVVSGIADAYVHSGGMYQWDSAAPVAVALTAGLHASRLDGSPLIYNDADPWLPDFVICRPELAEPILDAVAAVLRRGR